MKIRKILAAIAASAVAVSAMAVNVFAATFEGSHTMADSSWWTQDVIMDVENGVPMSNLIGDLDPASVTSITFTSDTTFIVGYNTAAGEWYQTPNEGVTSITVTDLNLGSNENNPYLHLCISKGDGVEYTINWTATAEDADDDSANDDAAADDSANDDTAADEIVADDSANDAVADETANDAPAAEAANDAPAADTDTNAAATGNVPVAVMVSVMAVAGVAAVASRKRK